MGRNLTVFFILGLVFFGGIAVYNEGKLPAITSPIPKVFGVTSEEKKVENGWFPKEGQLIASGFDLNISARSALLVDYDSEEVLFAKNPKNRQAVASTVKIMTALVALERAKLSDVFAVSEEAS